MTVKVLRCDQLETVRAALEPPMRLSSGTLLSPVRCPGGDRVILQLPTCYAPAGLLHDFDDGVTLTLRLPETVADARFDSLARLCSDLALAAPATSDSAAATTDKARPAPNTGTTKLKLPVSDDSRCVTVRNRRFEDVRFFDVYGAGVDSDRIHPGELVTALVAVEHAWTAPKSRGVLLKLLQVIVHTERQRLRTCLIHVPNAPDGTPRGSGPPPPPPPPPPPGGRARANGTVGSGCRSQRAESPLPIVPRNRQPRPQQNPGWTPPSSAELVAALTSLRRRPPKAAEPKIDFNKN